MWRILGVVAALATAVPATANDTMAELAAGGLIFVRSEFIAMESEDLYISPTEIRVDYVFRNRADDDIEAVVAFPMPDIVANPYAMAALPVPESDNFLDFTVRVGGSAVEPALDQRAFAAEVDVTEELIAAGVPVNPNAPGAAAAIAALDRALREDWVARGILFIDTYDIGQGMQDHYVPYWTLKSTFWWKMRFPAGRPVEVAHRYTPGVGGTTGLNFFYDGKAQGETYARYKDKYCLDDAIIGALRRSAAGDPYGNSPYWENWISYVLTTGANWATTIERFRLTVDKGDPANLVSFCGEGVRKTGPTTFEMNAEYFYPQRDIEILLLRRMEDMREDPTTADEVRRPAPRVRRPQP